MEIRLGFLKTMRDLVHMTKIRGELIGVINDYVQNVTSILGRDTIKFRLIGFDLEENQIEALQEGKIDMIFSCRSESIYGRTK